MTEEDEHAEWLAKHTTQAPPAEPCNDEADLAAKLALVKHEAEQQAQFARKRRKTRYAVR